ncbi:sensor histidine kinase [Saccharothrix luteola]|uniref:sensor histidine kinase n=1 Tax=Saccharothrix luteola TaxID=2893018 RepID=UPI001E3C9AD9|nr:sensor histidine kinase [Saccharothrix luteola]MCC8244077.1 sensor histidine kinase [Saccharothrix luteola]
MTSVEEQLGLLREHRWNQAWALAPLGLLLLACAVSVATGPRDWSEQAATLGVAVALAVWHTWFVVLHPQWWDRWVWPMVGYFVGLLAFTSALVLRDEAFQLFVPMCYVLAFLALPGWPAYVGVVAANVPWLVVPGTDPSRLLLNLTLSTALAVLVGAMIRAMEREAIRRRETNAELVAVAAENARLHGLLVEQARAAGVAGERARLAREIHDTVAQGLTGIVTQLEAIDERAVPPGRVRSRLEIAGGLARTSLVEVRRSIEALRPGPLEDARLGDAVRQAVTTWREQYGVPATVTVTGTPQPLHSEVEVTVLRAAQEALSNVGRHASAGRVDVTLSYMEDVVVLDVRDDGTGFTPGHGGGFGLTALRERVRALAGGVDIESAPGGGTAVSVTVPAIGVHR